MALFALVPGLPLVPFLAGAAVLGATGEVVRRKAQRRAAEEARSSAPKPEAPRRKSMGDILDLDEIHVEFAPSLVAMVLDLLTTWTRAS